MITLGGVIGAGLFVGSGSVINAVGPAAVLTYLIAGALMILIMRMLGEMAVAHPSVGSFSDYSRAALGNWAGFSVGWLYWYLSVIVIALEAIAGAGIIRQWVPGVPLWLLALLLLCVLTLTNLYSVRSYGEFEFWFSSIKVAAIVVFIGMAVLFVSGAWPGETPGLSNLYATGGFAPNGALAIFTGIVTVIFAYNGVEIVTIAAAESDDPRRNLARAVNTVIVRIIIFYVVSIFLVLAIVGWDSNFTAGTVESPFAVALQDMGVPAVSTLMNLVILTAVLSVLNSTIYSTSRIIFALTRQGDAPRSLAETSGRGVPVKAILASMLVSAALVMIAYFFPEGIFNFLVNACGVVALIVYLFVAVSQLRLRARYEREAPERLQVRMWLYPYLTYVGIFSMLAVLVSMLFFADLRSQLFLSLFSFGVILAVYAVREFWRGRLGREVKPS